MSNTENCAYLWDWLEKIVLINPPDCAATPVGQFLSILMLLMVVVIPFCISGLIAGHRKRGFGNKSERQG